MRLRTAATAAAIALSFGYEGASRPAARPAVRAAVYGPNVRAGAPECNNLDIAPRFETSAIAVPRAHGSRARKGFAAEARRDSCRLAVWRAGGQGFCDERLRHHRHLRAGGNRAAGRAARSPAAHVGSSRPPRRLRPAGPSEESKAGPRRNHEILTVYAETRETTPPPLSLPAESSQRRPRARILYERLGMLAAALCPHARAGASNRETDGFRTPAQSAPRHGLPDGPAASPTPRPCAVLVRQGVPSPHLHALERIDMARVAPPDG